MSRPVRTCRVAYFSEFALRQKIKARSLLGSSPTTAPNAQNSRKQRTRPQSIIIASHQVSVYCAPCPAAVPIPLTTPTGSTHCTDWCGAILQTTDSCCSVCIIVGRLLSELQMASRQHQRPSLSMEEAEVRDTVASSWSDPPCE